MDYCRSNDDNCRSCRTTKCLSIERNNPDDCNIEQDGLKDGKCITGNNDYKKKSWYNRWGGRKSKKQRKSKKSKKQRTRRRK